MAIATTTAVTSFTFNSVTYNASTGGPIAVEMELDSQTIMDAVADQDTPSFFATTGKVKRVRVTMRDAIVAAALVLGTSAGSTAMVLYSGQTVNLGTMRLERVEIRQPKDEKAEAVLHLVGAV